MQNCGDRKPSRARQLTDEPKHRHLVRRIEVHGRFVEQKHVGLLRERHREDGALPLAARQTIDATRGKIAKVKIRDRALDGSRIRPRCAAKHPKPRCAPKRDHFTHAERKQGVEDLRDDRDAPRELRARQGRDVNTIDPHRP